ncbi:hypothetical protein ACRALDRAFT_2017794 [Sodiomyces alcalophilus JCM 7366]|uniref:uncharacterized protein n=1 Tax=Sodiomyces alcalophilus JCM 7366 TaxID=591952 RepID=UPI0039B3E62E
MLPVNSLSLQTSTITIKEINHTRNSLTASTLSKMKLLSVSVSLFAAITMALPNAINHSTVQTEHINDTALAVEADAVHHSNTTVIAAKGGDDRDCNVECSLGMGYCKAFPRYFHCNKDGNLRFIMPDPYCSLGCKGRMQMGMLDTILGNAIIKRGFLTDSPYSLYLVLILRFSPFTVCILFIVHMEFSYFQGSAIFSPQALHSLLKQQYHSRTQLLFAPLQVPGDRQLTVTSGFSIMKATCKSNFSPSQTIYPYNYFAPSFLLFKPLLHGHAELLAIFNAFAALLTTAATAIVACPGKPNVDNTAITNEAHVDNGDSALEVADTAKWNNFRWGNWYCVTGPVLVWMWEFLMGTMLDRETVLRWFVLRVSIPWLEVAVFLRLLLYFKGNNPLLRSSIPAHHHLLITFHCIPCWVSGALIRVEIIDLCRTWSLFAMLMFVVYMQCIWTPSPSVFITLAPDSTSTLSSDI